MDRRRRIWNAARGRRQAAAGRRGHHRNRRAAGLQAIEAYRVKERLWDLLGNKERSVIAVTTIDGEDIFGANSDSRAYTSADFAAAKKLRDILVRKHQSKLSAENLGRMPNNALFHAETTVLLRAAERAGGTLAGRTLTVYGDTDTCNNCEIVLPYVGLELGNPTVTFVNPDGTTRSMRDGSWIKEGSK
jgi:hypothetical protein